VASRSCQSVWLPQDSAHSPGRASPPEKVVRRMIAEWMDFAPGDNFDHFLSGVKLFLDRFRHLC